MQQQHSLVWLLTMCLIWIDVVPLFCDVNIVTAISFETELSFLSPANRSQFSTFDLFEIEFANKSPNNVIETSFSTVSNHNRKHNHQQQQQQHRSHSHPQHHLHHHHHRQHHPSAEKINRWNMHQLNDDTQKRHSQNGKKTVDHTQSMWISDASNGIQPKVRRRHEKRWHHRHRNHRQFIDHADQITSKLHADLEIQSARMVDMANDTASLPMHWPVKKEAIMEGDVILGGLMMVHSREEINMCGPIMPQGGIQALEAMLYTLDQINENLRLLPNITIGAHILDDCDRDSYGLEMAVDFIKGMSPFPYHFLFISISISTAHENRIFFFFFF